VTRRQEVSEYSSQQGFNVPCRGVVIQAALSHFRITCRPSARPGYLHISMLAVCRSSFTGIAVCRTPNLLPVLAWASAPPLWPPCGCGCILRGASVEVASSLTSAASAIIDSGDALHSNASYWGSLMHLAFGSPTTARMEIGT